MLILGLTGNIGCGKSTLSNIFIKNNIKIIDADIISRKIFEDEKLLQDVFDTFGESIKCSDGSLNRKALGNIVFNDDNKLKKLNSLTHPRIYDNIKNKIKTLRNEEIVVVDAALLIEGEFLSLVDKLAVITCDLEVQIKRIQKRDNISKEEVMNRINSQMNQSEKIKYADYIIDNSKDYESLEIESNKFIRYIKENWCE